MAVETCSPTFCKDSTKEATSLDFRAQFLRGHFETLIARGYGREQAKDIVTGIAAQDLKYLFLERFTQEKLVHFNYFLEDGELLSPGYEVFGDVCGRYQAGITQRELDGKPAHREVAELEGIVCVKESLKNSEGDKAFLIISPPENADYNFYFFGKFDSESRQVDMFAWRNNKTLALMAEEANRLRGGNYFSVLKVHPNDFLRQPIFVSGASFDAFGDAIDGMPKDSEFGAAKSADFSEYRVGIERLASMLSELVANGASDETLQLAQLKVEMEFTKWVCDGTVEMAADFDKVHLPFVMHREFEKEIRREFGYFAMVYKTDQFACGSCGGSIMSLFTSGSLPYIPTLMQESMLNFFPSYRACPGCGDSVRIGSEECKGCGLKRVDYNRQKANR